MAIPVLGVVAILAQASGHVLTKPWPWLLVGAWFAAAKIDFGILREAVSETIASLWWVIVLILLASILRAAFPEYLKWKRRAEGSGQK